LLARARIALLEIVLIALHAAFGAGTAHATCGAAFCAVNTNWDSHGAWAEPGWRLDLRYERIDQDQPQAGSRKISVGEIRKHHDEVFTRNRNWLATLDYTVDADWGVSVSLPFVDRSHLHLHNHMGAQLPEAWDFRNAGDARVLARYRLSTFEEKEPEPRLGTIGLTFGLKLPSGKIDVRNGSGDLAEHSLQPGTGTTDALLGAYYAQMLPVKDLSWFVQGLLQVPLNSRDQFQPGRRLSVDAGLRYDLNESVGVMLQVNALYRGRDQGANAEPDDSGGTAGFVSPGISVGLTKDVRAYAFYQVPIHQHVNGVQLVSRNGAVIGLSARF